MERKKKLVLVDGSSYLFRAYHALPPLTTSSGHPTGAMYGVINMLRRLIKDSNPHYIAVIFDTKEKTFRHELYEDYKANRPEMPEDLAVQIQPLHDMIKAMGLPLIAMPGFEADDVIGTLARQAEERDIEVLISTSDKDLAQLVTKHVTLVNTMTNTVLDEKGVLDKFGVRPDQIIDYLALMGDASDNVPGIPKVGPKTAVKWLQEYHDVKNLIAHATEINGKIGENLRAHIDNIPLSQQLVTIHRDVPVKEEIETLVRAPQNLEKLQTLFTQFNFKTWLKEIESEVVQTPKPREAVAYHTVFEMPVLQQLYDHIKKEKAVCFDLETTSLDTRDAEIVGVSLSVKALEAYYIPVGHVGITDQIPLNKVLEGLKPLLEDPSINKIGQNLKYDIEVLLNYDIQVKGNLLDTMLESYVVNSTVTKHNMDDLAEFYLNYKTMTYEDVAGKGAKQIPFAEVPLEKAAFYAAEDADITMRLHEVLHEKLNAVEKLSEVYNTIESPLVPVLVKMESIGVKIDAHMLEQQSEFLGKKIIELEQQAYLLAGEEFNMGSPKQLQTILYDKLQLPMIAKTPTGQPSTAENVLSELGRTYELPKIILEYRSLSKLKSTYTDSLPNDIHARTHRVHTSYHQAVTATGRLSSSNPNLQNIPMRTEEGQKIRKAFIAERGSLIVACDYSQIELRIMAHLSQDKGLLKAFELGEDIHKFTASEMFKIPLAEVSAIQRRSAKAINFGLIYGMSAFGLARQLDTTREEAEGYMRTYFERYPGVKTYMENTRLEASKKGYVETIFGRRLYLPDINAKNVPVRKAAERTAINAPMQGSAADIIKKAMIKIHDWIEGSERTVKMIMQVHDELVFEVPEQLVDKASLQIKNLMENTTKLDVPLVVSLGVGQNWQEAH